MKPTRFDDAVLNNDPVRRGPILAVLESALAAVDPASAVRRTLRRQADHLQVGERRYDLAAYERVILLAFGKAAAPMVQATAEALADRLTAGMLLTKYGHGPAEGVLPEQIVLLEAGHPLPDQVGEAAARRIVALAEQATARDLVLCLISGGGSALLTLPAEGLELADLQAVTQALLRCGASIDEINTLRKHLSRVKGGQLARLISPATLISLLLSDVVGSSPDIIASGPTAPDRSTWADAWAIIEKYNLAGELPQPVIERLQAGLAGHLTDTPKEGDPAFQKSQTLIIADNALAAQAASQRAAELGFHPLILSTFVEGEAREVARVAVALGREVVAHGRPVARPACLILGGETTVTLRGAGKGGRNQELALAAALLLDRIAEGQNLVIASLATDGSDGPTDAAGGLADSMTVARGRARHLAAAGHLADNNAYPFLEAVGDLLISGPTQTNVNDLICVFAF